MAEMAGVLEYKCPCCNAGLTFSDDTQNMHCEYCGNNFAIDTIKAYHDQDQDDKDGFAWEEEQTQMTKPLVFQCRSCGAALDADAHTAATFCPYCDNSIILTDRTSAFFRPDAVLPFKTSEQDAHDAFRKLCKGKLLLPKDFSIEHRIDRISAHYVPFWLYSCSGQQAGKYRATRVRTWSDSQYQYTKTDYFLLNRAARAEFSKIPMDGSSKMDDTIMESIEPFDYDQMVDFDNAYLSGFLADKYDVEAKDGEGRIRERVGKTMDGMILSSCVGYTSVVPIAQTLDIKHSKAKYVMLPVWMMQTRYKDQEYTFAMNGQSGKMTGTFPICPKKSLAWFCGVSATVAAIVGAILLLV